MSSPRRQQENEEASARGRREKHRRRRNQRLDDRTATEETKSDNDDDAAPVETQNGCEPSPNHQSPADVTNTSENRSDSIVSEPGLDLDDMYQPSSREERSEESGRDIVGELRSHPSTAQRLSEIGVAPRNNSAGDYIPPEASPGAFWQLGRGVGDLPAWFSRSTRVVRAAPNTAGMPRVGSNVRIVPVSSVPFLRGEQSDSEGHRSSIISALSSGRSSHGTPPSVIVSRPRRRGSFISNSLRSIFGRRRSSIAVPVAEPLQAEKVVYAIVQEEEDDDYDDETCFCSWELGIYTAMVLVAGIAIGRLTAPGAAAISFSR